MNRFSGTKKNRQLQHERRELQTVCYAEIKESSLRWSGVWVLGGVTYIWFIIVLIKVNGQKNVNSLSGIFVRTKTIANGIAHCS